MADLGVEPSSGGYEPPVEAVLLIRIVSCMCSLSMTIRAHNFTLVYLREKLKQSDSLCNKITYIAYLLSSDVI